MYMDTILSKSHVNAYFPYRSFYWGLTIVLVEITVYDTDDSKTEYIGFYNVTFLQAEVQS